MLVPNVVTMSSLEMVEFINSTRKEGEAELRHSDFLVKVPKVLGGGERNFSSTYLSSQNKQLPCYRFPKREACLMAMSYSYELQARVFDRMTELEEKNAKPQTTLEIIAAQTQVLIQQEREIAQLKDRVVRVEAKQQAFEEGFKYFTVLGYAAYKGITVALSDAQTIGKQAAKLSRERNVPIDKVADQRFGRVNSYHESILDETIANTL